MAAMAPAGIGRTAGPPLSPGLIARELRHALDPVAWAMDRLGFQPDPWQARVLRTSHRQVLLNCTR